MLLAVLLSLVGVWGVDADMWILGCGGEDLEFLGDEIERVEGFVGA